MKTLKSRKRHALAIPRKPHRRPSSRTLKSRVGSGRRAESSRAPKAARPTSGNRIRGRRGQLSPGEIERQRIDAQYQTAVKNFEAAVRAFQKQKYRKAMETFENLVDSEFTEVVQRARMYMRLCQQKVNRSGPARSTAEEYYTLGVAALNARELERAIEHLGKAEKLRPNKDHIQYALAAAHSLRGNVSSALEHLKVAIRLRPEDRFQARRDEDFQGLASDSRFRRLVYAQGL